MFILLCPFCAGLSLECDLSLKHIRTSKHVQSFMANLRTLNKLCYTLSLTFQLSPKTSLARAYSISDAKKIIMQCIQRLEPSQYHAADAPAATQVVVLSTSTPTALSQSPLQFSLSQPAASSQSPTFSLARLQSMRPAIDSLRKVSCRQTRKATPSVFHDYFWIFPHLFLRELYSFNLF